MFSEFESLLITYLIVILGGILWEISENTFLIWTKVFDERDYVINSQMDVVLVFFGGILGCYLYDELMLAIFVIAGLFVAFYMGRILTKMKFRKK